MLQQILADMYIDPELLAELGEDQKQILFCKMREEQVRLYEEKEAEMEQKEKKFPRPKPARKPGKKAVSFKNGSDGNPWVWVMGDHQDDKSIEQILEEEAQEKARILAEKEAEALSKIEEEKLRQMLSEQEKLDQERKERIAKIRRKAEQERLAKEKIEEEKKKQEEEQKKNQIALRDKTAVIRRQSMHRISQLKTKRTSELYESFKVERIQKFKEAEADSKEVELRWKESERKAKKIEAERQSIARNARLEHRNSLKGQFVTAAKVIGLLAAEQKKSKGPAPEPPPRNKKAPRNMQMSKPKNKQDVIDWFRTKERVKDTVTDPESKQIAPWFHGLISREDAEQLLENKKRGTFLVRVSEKIWGYAISYCGEERCKHFLIDASDGSYQFFGTNQLLHSKLWELIKFHRNNPITSLGQELLLYPCGQVCDPPDYYELLQIQDNESSYL